MPNTPIQPNDHAAYLQHCLSQARLSPPLPTNFRVGALILDSAANKILATGFTLELPGNTHAEQCCIQKLLWQHGVEEAGLGEKLPEETVLYTTMEPCVKRLSGQKSCVERVLELTRADGTRAIKKVYVGVVEPETFVKDNQGKKLLEDAGIDVVVVPGMEEEILKVAMAGHNISDGN
jgi:pyrimidine deaminase RibD-like protein